MFFWRRQAVADIGPAELAAWLRSKPGLQLVDVRQPDEFSQGHIPAAHLLPLGELEQQIAELDPRRPVVAVCRSGNRSATACRKLSQLNFEAYNLAGGMLKWDGPVVRDDP